MEKSGAQVNKWDYIILLEVIPGKGYLRILRIPVVIRRRPRGNPLYFFTQIRYVYFIFANYKWLINYKLQTVARCSFKGSELEGQHPQVPTVALNYNQDQQVWHEKVCGVLVWIQYNLQSNLSWEDNLRTDRSVTLNRGWTRVGKVRLHLIDVPTLKSILQPFE